MNTCSCKCFHFQYQKNWDSNMRNNQARVHQKVNDQRLQPCITQDCEHTAVKKVTFTLPVYVQWFSSVTACSQRCLLFLFKIDLRILLCPLRSNHLAQKILSWHETFKSAWSWIVFSSLLWRIKWKGFLLDFVHLDLIWWYCCEWQDAPPSHQ